jgi:gamma-glutamyltranspeptidase/glutathione hydrolase
VPPRPHRLLVVLLALAVGLGGASSSASRQIGAVASSEAAATEVGLEILRDGGNAVDAAVAVALALAVVHPEAGNLGGGGFAVIRFEGELYSLDFRETAPAAATSRMFLDERGEKVPDASWVGPLASGVPGSPFGLWELHRKFGSLAWSRIVEPAIRLAGGFTVSPRLSARLASKRSHLANFEETARVWLPGGVPPRPGTTMTLPELARTLELYAAHGPEGVTTGSVADAVVNVVGRYGGILTTDDLASYRPVWRQPLRFTAFGWQFASIGLPSSGGVLVAQGLRLLEILGWADKEPLGVDRAHLLAEVWRRGFADRMLLGDPLSTEATPAELLEPDWLAVRAASIDLMSAADSTTVLPWPGERPAEPQDTTHLSVVDADGNLVALTTTLNGNFGNGLLVPGAGFFLNNEMDDFTTVLGQPNDYGLIQGTGNLVRPGHRMLSSTAPTIAWRGEEAIALGGRGGSKIPTATLQVLLGVLVDGLDLQSAIERRRLHHQWLPDRLLVEENALSAAMAAELELRGHAIHVEPDSNNLPKVHGVRVLASGSMEVGADPRGPGVGRIAEDSNETQEE